MSALMCDTLLGRVAPEVARAAASVGTRLLRVVELQLRYSRDPQAGAVLMLVPEGEKPKKIPA